MSTCCPICYRVRDEHGTIQSNSDKHQLLQLRFFQLFERYLDEDRGGGDLQHQLLKLSELTDNTNNRNGQGTTIFLSCEQCHKLMKSFCDLLHQLKTIELLLSWKAETLKNVMGCAGRVPQRMEGFRDFIRKKLMEEGSHLGIAAADEQIDKMVQWKKSLIKKCCRKSAKSFPKLSIEKWKPLVGPAGKAYSPEQIPPSSPQHVDDDESQKEADTLETDRKPCQVEEEDVVPNTEQMGSESSSDSENYYNDDEDDDKDQLIRQSSSEQSSSARQEDEVNLDSELPSANITGSPQLLVLESAVATSPDLGVKEGSLIPFEEIKMDCSQDFSEAEVIPAMETTDPKNESPEELELPLPSLRKRLRPIHQCPKCMRTFSTLEKLKGHQPSHEGEESGGGSSSSENEMEQEEEDPVSECELPVPDNTESEEEQKNDSLSPTLTPKPNLDKPTARPRPDLGTGKKKRNENVNNKSPSRLNPKRDRKKDFRLKCPDCSRLFQVMKTLLLHCSRDSGNHQEPYDPKGTMKVEVLVPPSNNHKNSQAKKKKCPNLFSTVFAILDVPKAGFSSSRSQCPICHTPGFMSRRDSLAHFKTSHDLSRITPPKEVKRCGEPHCPAYFLKINQLHKHQRSRHALTPEPRQFPCQVANCPEVFQDKGDYQEHQRFHGKFPCLFCDLVLDYAGDLAWHEISEHSIHNGTSKRVKMLKCPRPNCSYGSGSKINYLRHHVKAHLKLDPKGLCNTDTCDICGMLLTARQLVSERYSMKHHERFHTPKEGEPISRCDLEGCSAYFRQPLQLREHKKEVHELEEGFTCLMCNASFVTPTRLRNHRRKAHPEVFTYGCTHPGCGHHAESELTLSQHVKQTHEVKPKSFHCPDCDQTFLTEFTLRKHRVTHESGGKRHACHLCGKRFKEKGGLEQHAISHSGPDSWEFLCGLCPKKCRSQGKLTEHMRTHSREKPYVCQVCGVRYAHRHNLRNHVNSKHGDEVQDIPKKYDKTNLTSRKKEKGTNR